MYMCYIYVIYMYIYNIYMYICNICIYIFEEKMHGYN